MGSMYNIEKMIESTQLQLQVICKILGIDPLPAPNDENYDAQAIQQQIEGLTDPDA